MGGAAGRLLGLRPWAFAPLCALGYGEDLRRVLPRSGGIHMRIRWAIVAAFLALAGCAAGDLEETPKPMGDFQLGFVVPITSPNLTKGPVSREATPEEWKDAMKQAFDARFSRFEGDAFYHLGVIVEGYVLAQPGIPLVLSPKSALIFSITVIEDATQETLTPEPHQITVVESIGAGTLLGSGLVMSREEQLEELARNAAVATERWLRQQPWFYEEGTIPEDALEGLPEVATVDADVPVDEVLDPTGDVLAPEAADAPADAPADPATGG